MQMKEQMKGPNAAVVLLLATSLIDFFPSSRFVSGLAGVFLLCIAYNLLAEAIGDGESKDGDKENKQSAKESTGGGMYLLLIVIRGFLYPPFMRWALSGGASWIRGIAAAGVLIVFIELCFFAIYRRKIRTSELRERIGVIGYFSSPVIIGAAAVLPRFFNILLPEVTPVPYAQIALEVSSTVVLLLPLLVCVRRITRKPFETAVSVILSAVLAATATLMYATAAGRLDLRIEQALVYGAIFNGALAIAAVIVYRVKKDESAKKYIAWLGVSAFVPPAAYYGILRWGWYVTERTEPLFADSVQFLLYLALFFVYIMAMVIIGDIVIETNKPQAVKPSLKKCLQCGESIPADILAGEKCPLCGAAWNMLSSTNQIRKKPKQTSYAEHYTQRDDVGLHFPNIESAELAWMNKRMTSAAHHPVLKAEFDSADMMISCIADIPFFHNIGKMFISTEVIEFGVFAQLNKGLFFMCGDDMTMEDFMSAREVLVRAGGKITEETKPLKQKKEMGPSPESPQVRYVKTQQNGANEYAVHQAPSKLHALEYLKDHPVNRPQYYLVIETPEGTYCRDKDGIYLE